MTYKARIKKIQMKLEVYMIQNKNCDNTRYTFRRAAGA
jgi:hypothetical protein